VPKEDLAPVWARPDAFPKKPSVVSDSGVFAYGYIDTKANQSGYDSVDELKAAVGKSRHGVELAWVPEHDELIAAEEVVELRATLWKRRKNWASDDLADGKRMSCIFLLVLLYYLYNAYTRTGDVMSALRLPTVGIAGILLLMFGLVPLYEGWKTLRKGAPKSEDDWDAEIAESRFDTWLYRQKAPLTYCLLALMLVLGVTQLLVEELNMEWSAKSIVRGGLLKQSVDGIGGEWWRFTY